MNHSSAPRILDNEVFEGGGIYPGGTGIIKEFRYRLWDYGGTQPQDSNIAVYCLFQPTDGSNENKPEEIYWNIGPSAEFMPHNDGRQIVSMHARTAMSDSCNWKFVQEKFKNNCGLTAGALNGPNGLFALIGSQVTFTRVDQPTRDNLPEKPAADGKDKKGFKKTILIPTWAKFPWETGTPRPQVAVPAAPVAQPAAHTAPATTQATIPMPPAPAPMNGAAGSVDIGEIISALLTEHNGTIPIASLPALVMNKLPTVTREVRVATIKKVNDPASVQAIADTRGWTVAGDSLVG